jgi:phosphatidylglycerol---prolipoprotein diacylglyceryl transferase
MKPALLLYPHISAYPVLLLLGFFFGWLLARSRARFYGILPRDLDNIGLVLPLAGLFGARFFARLFYAKLPLLDALKVWEGDGLVFYGGFIFGIGAVLLYGLLRKIRLSNLVDCVAPSVALGLAFGRIGCFMAGCCWGDVCLPRGELAVVHDPQMVKRIQTFPAISPSNWPLSVKFPKRSDAYQQHVKLGLLSAEAANSLRVHPVQLYEAFLAASLCAYLCLQSRRARHQGDIALAMLAGYAAIRFATEFLRADNKVYAFGLTFSQVVSIWILLGCVIWIAVRSILMRGRFRFRIQAERPLAPIGTSGSSSSIYTTSSQRSNL